MPQRAAPSNTNTNNLHPVPGCRLPPALANTNTNNQHRRPRAA